MIKVSKKRLAIVAMSLDNNNPKFELNYLYIDNENMVSTDTRRLSVVKHLGKNESEPFLIHQTVVRLALKQTKAEEFILMPNTIMCLDKHGRQLMILQKDLESSKWNFPDYERIVPKSIEKTIPYNEDAQVAGIFAINHIHINHSYIPPLVGKSKTDEIYYAGINERNLPVVIFDEYKEIKVIIMPIIDTLPIIDEACNKQSA